MQHFTIEQAIDTHCTDQEKAQELLSALNDKMYLYAASYTTNPEARTMELRIDSENCLTFLNDKFKQQAIKTCKQIGIDEGWAERAPTVNQIRDGERAGLLISSSALLADSEGKLMLVERDEGAPVDPLKWQAPGGRSETIDAIDMALAELSQEISITDRRSGEFLTETDFQVASDTPDTNRITVLVDGKPALEYEAPGYLDQETNTLENLVFLKTSEPASNYTLKDNEFGRKVEFLDKADLISGQYDLVGYLNDLLDGERQRLKAALTEDEDLEPMIAPR